ncbi:MAG: hypothetical protein Tsb0017_27820 [Geothermobacteraceae bacterium]
MNSRYFWVIILGLSLLLTAGCGGGGGGGTVVTGVQSSGGIDTTPADDGNPATPPAVFAIPAAINDNNELVGTSETTAGGVLQAAYWMVNNTGAATVEASNLQSLAPDLFAAAHDLNGAGVIAGSAENTDTSIRAVVWDDNASAPRILQGLAPGADADANAINADGRIVGSSEDGNFLRKAVYWDRSATDGSLTGPFQLPGVPADWESEAWAVNDDGVIAGELIDLSGISHAAIWQPDVAGYVRVDLPTPVGFDHAIAFGLNNAAAGGTAIQVVGETSDDNLNAFSQAVIWSLDLAAVPATVTATDEIGVNNRDSSALAVSDAGRTVGWQDSATDVSQAVFWDGAAPASVLVSTDSQAFDINAGNLVVGRSGTVGFVKLAN